MKTFSIILNVICFLLIYWMHYTIEYEGKRLEKSNEESWLWQRKCILMELTRKDR